MNRRSLIKSVASAFIGAGMFVFPNKTASPRDVKSVNVEQNSSRVPFIETKDRTFLFYKDWGTGKPVVFVHSWALNSDMWQYQMINLSNHNLRCIAYDRRGHGRSSQPGHGYDFDTLASDLFEVIEQLNLREVTLVSHSMGSGEIVRYLTRYSTSRISRAVLISPITPFLLKTTDNPDGVEKSRLDQLRALLSKDAPHLIASGMPSFFGSGLPNISVSTEMIQWGLNQCLVSSLKALVDCNLAMTETDFRMEMQKITIPTLIIHGNADKSAPIGLTGEKSSRLIPNSKLVVYEGAPHGLPFTHMDRLNRELLEFVS